MIPCSSYLAQDAANELATGYKPRMVEVVHDGVKPGRYLLIFLQTAASELGVLLTERQWRLWLKWRLVIQALGVTAPLPGLEDKQQHEEEAARAEGVMSITGLRAHVG